MIVLDLCRPVDWGSAPAWLGAIGSILAFTLAVRIYWVNSKDGRMEQARKVSMLISGAPTRLKDTGTTIQELRSELPSGLSHTGGTHYEASGDLARWDVTVWNRSNETVGAIEGEILDKHGAEVVRLQAFGSLGPDTERTFSLVSTYDPSYQTDHRLRYRFTDAAGRRWVREQDRALRQLGRGDVSYQ